MGDTLTDSHAHRVFVQLTLEQNWQQFKGGTRGQARLLQRQQAFGYTQEDIGRFIEPMATKGDDPIGSMGTDTPIADAKLEALRKFSIAVTESRGWPTEAQLDDLHADAHEQCFIANSVKTEILVG